MKKLPSYIERAVYSGPMPKVRNWRKLVNLTKAEKVMLFAESFLLIPEGEHVGKPLKLSLYQECFIYSVVDSGASVGILSIGRRNGKTFVIAILALAYLIGPLSETNQVIASAAMSKNQAALVFRAMEQMINMSEVLSKYCRVVPSTKRIVNLSNGAEYYAMSAEAKTGHGKSLKVVILDESGQIQGESNGYVEMLRTSQGSYSNPLFLTISTQSASDADYLSILIDDAQRTKDSNTVCHVYTADKKLAIDDEEAWLQSNPGIKEGFRSVEDIKKQAAQAKRLPSMEAGFENLILNRRTSLLGVWLSASVWRANSNPPSWDLFRKNGVTIGLDLSQRLDLTVACLSAKDENDCIHVYPYCFTPLVGVEERERRDKTPYQTWIKQGHLIGVPGKTIDYNWVADFLRVNVEQEGIIINEIAFDRWRITEFKSACERSGLECYNFKEVGQGYKDISPRVSAMECALLQEKVFHGANPLLNLAASHAIVIEDPSGNKKVDRRLSTQKIDPIIAMLMSIYEHIAQTEEGFGEDVGWLIG